MRAVYDIIPQKIEAHRTRLTAVGNLIDYSGHVSPPTSDLTAMKLHVKRAILDVKSKYMSIYVKCFYLNNIMDRAEKIKSPSKRTQWIHPCKGN